MSQPNREKLEGLAEKWANGTISEAEKLEFIDWFNEFGDRELHLTVDALGKEPELKTAMWNTIREGMDEKRKKSIRLWPAVAAAVAVAIVVFIGIVRLFFYGSHTNTAVTTASKTVLPQDIAAPNRNKAMIKMDDGSTIFLDRATNGALATINSVRIVKSAASQLSYEGTSDLLSYNTLINPKGSNVIFITLSDGTRAWLNCGSSLRYPVTFTGEERRVSITGEAYFEVAHNAQKPFIVDNGHAQINVLGTHFNVNSYQDEVDIKVTLLEGKIKVIDTTSAKFKVLTPGQQVQLQRSGELLLKDAADVQQVMAWKNGLFSFRGAEFTSVMRELARWYDLEVVYDGPLPKGRIRGEISKDLTLSQILTGLSMSRINYKIDGKKITISSI